MKQKNNFLPKFITSNFTLIITLAIILSLILVASVGVTAWRMYDNFSKIVTSEFQLQSLTGKIVYLDEVLTMSARMAAATGNLDWEQRYRQFEPQLDRAIEQVISLAPETYDEHADETDLANTQLVKIENQAFALVRQGNSQTALELLLGQKYQFQKQIYAQGINQTIAALETRIKYNIKYKNKI